MRQVNGETASDFATRAYVDEVATGIKTRPSVRAATTANLSATYNNGTNGVGATLTASSNGAFPTIDGVGSWSQYHAILVKDQTTAAHNGVYIITTVGNGSTPWVLTRRTPMDEASEIPGSYVFVSDGSVNKARGYVLSVANPGTFVVGTDAIDSTQFSQAQAYEAGAGLILSGSTFAVQTESSTRILVNADAIDLATVNVTNTNVASTTNFVSGLTVDNYGRVTATQKADVNFSQYATLASPTFTGNVSLPSTTSIGNVSNTEIEYLDGVTSNIQGQLDAKYSSASASADLALKANLASPTFTGTVVLPSTTSIGNVSNTEIGYLDGVTSNIQAQLNDKAPKAEATFTGNVSLPSTTSIGNVSGAEIGYLDGVTSNIQAQIDAKLDSTSASNVYLTEADAANTYIANSIVDAKGDLIVASAADTVGRLAAGTNGQFLRANSSASVGLEWAAIPTINNLDDVGDVTITGNATGQFLKYNGSAWVNDSIPTINALNDVGDVTITSVATNDLLAWDGTAWVNKTNPTIGGNLVVTGNLTVQGNTTTVSTQELHVSDNIIVLNHDVTGSPTENAGIEIERGTSTNVLVRWNETDDCWEFTNDGTKYERIVGDTLTNAQTAAYTLVLADRSKMVEMSVASGHNLTVPTNANVAFPVGTTITVLQTGAGQTTIAGQSGVTINATPGLKLRAQWSSATLIKRATDTWVALGDLAA